jgi:hypothetical protein
LKQCDLIIQSIYRYKNIASFSKQNKFFKFTRLLKYG